MSRQITAFSNTLAKRVRALRDKKHRRADGLFLAEWLRSLTEAREAGRIPEYLFFTAEGARHPLAASLHDAVERGCGEAIETNHDFLSNLSCKDNAQAVV